MENKKRTGWRVQWLVIYFVSVCLVRILLFHLFSRGIILCLIKQILICHHCHPVWCVLVACCVFVVLLDLDEGV
jgi:hypothetical protein